MGSDHNEGLISVWQGEQPWGEAHGCKVGHGVGSGPGVWHRAHGVAWCMAVWRGGTAMVGGAPASCGCIVWGAALGCGAGCFGRCGVQ